MKENGLTFNARMIYCFLSEEYWRKQVLTGFGTGLIMLVFILPLF